ncbi:hypothetical protein B7767_19820 [Streptomyces sp. 13-12-16]|nr:hypothetical protein B7767_19820 [Streptomyces sp. 13-12-16]
MLPCPCCRSMLISHSLRLGGASWLRRVAMFASPWLVRILEASSPKMALRVGACHRMRMARGKSKPRPAMVRTPVTWVSLRAVADLAIGASRGDVLLRQ